MHVSKKIKQSFLKNYCIEKVYYKDRLYNSTVKYLKKQKHLKSSKVLFLLNSFINKNYPICYILTFKNTKHPHRSHLPVALVSLGHLLQMPNL